MTASSGISASGTAKTTRVVHNALTVDVEDYFHVSAFEGVVRPEDWDTMPHRVCGNTQRVLELFAEFGVRGTFFLLGWVAERYPHLVRRVAEAGHEVACHGYSHRRLHTLTPEIFRQELERSKALLEDLSGAPVLGFRAPSWSVDARTLWAVDVLIEMGFVYDSSIFPIHHDIYGMPDAERFPHLLRRPEGAIPEFPPTTLPLSVGGRNYNLPVAGGGYLRLLPVPAVWRAMRHVNQREGMPAVLYFHPWELDPRQPRVAARGLSRFRHYLNLQRMEDKLRYLLRRMSFAPMADVLAEQGLIPAGTAELSVSESVKESA